MCLVKKPKIPDPTKDSQGQDKPLPILRNPILDGMLGNIAALRAGTSAFRIDLLNPLTIPMGGAPGAGGDSGGSSSGSSSGGTSSSSSSSSSGGSSSSGAFGPTNGGTGGRGSAIQ